MKDKFDRINNVPDLENLARQLRLDILESTTKAGSGHPSSSWSAVEILTAIYFGKILKYRATEPLWLDRDRFIMSKGHAAPLLYAVLARAGYFPYEFIMQLRQVNSPVQGHPILGLLPGVEATTGSLGQGLSIGVGHVLGSRLNHRNYRVYVLLGDGECEAGQIWESAMSAAHYKCDHLTAILDYNKFQETGPISREMGLEPLAEKWRSFGWHVEEVDGHSIPDLLEKLHSVQKIQGKPQIIIANTIKGKGVSFVESDYTFHGRALTHGQAQLAREELK